MKVGGVKMRRNGKKVLLIGVLILVLMGYFGYQGYHYILYRPENVSDKNYDEFMNSFVVHEDMEIHQKMVSEEDYFVFKNVKIRNDFKEYQLQYGNDGEQIYCLDDEFGNPISVFMVAIEETMIDNLLNVDALIEKTDKEQFFKKYGIENDLDLLDYVLEKHEVDNTIFTSVEKMKYNYMTQYFTYTFLSNPTYVTRIVGDYEGYLIGGESSQKWKNVNTVNIVQGDKLYQFSFWGSDKFTEQYIQDIVETIVIENYADESINQDTIFTRTYQVVDIIENNSLNYVSLKIKQFQEETMEVVEVKKDLAVNIEKNKNYEFTFRKSESSDLEDSMKSIFENTELIEIVETDKGGLDQIQEPIWDKN